jgi:hypothetical protein
MRNLHLMTSLRQQGRHHLNRPRIVIDDEDLKNRHRAHLTFCTPVMRMKVLKKDDRAKKVP